MTIKELTPENITPNQAKYFQPSKALPYKDYIIDKSFQGMTPKEIHNKLLEEFPEAKDVTLDSLKRMVKKYNQTKVKSKAKAKSGNLNKSDEVRKLVKEMISNGVQLNGSNIIKTLANRGIEISYNHVYAAIGQGLLNNEYQPPKTAPTTSILNPNPPKCDIDDLIIAKEFVNKLGGLDNTINILSTYTKFAK